MGSIEMGSLLNTFCGYYDTELLQKDFPPMNIDLDLYRAQRRRIECRIRKTSDKIEATRCRILLLLHAGHSVMGVAERVGCARATVYRTVYRFEELGEIGLSDRRIHPEARKVTPELMNYLLSLLELSPRSLGWQRSTWTLELMALQVEEKLKVKLSPSHVRNLLLWLGCRRGRPRPGLRIPFRGRRKILRALKRLVSRASENEEVFYQDEADIDLNPRIGPCYMRRGRQLVVLTPGKNQKRYVAGALNARTGRVIHTFSRSKNSGLFIGLLEKLKAAYRRAQKLHLILDNCIVHKSRQTQTWLRQFGNRLVLHFLPPYSPEHNVIERLWKQMHDHVTRNHRHPTMEDLILAIEQFLRGVQPFPGTKVSIRTMAA
jgi:putative transposase